jgi:cytochrome c-type biogenesis protein CcmH
MLFWLIIGALTLGASLAVLLPALRDRGSSVADNEHDIEVYRDQLREIERDQRRGVIAPAEAELARAEIGRRILKAAGETDAPRPADPSAGIRMTLTASVLAIPLASWGIYAITGSPDLPGQPLQARLDVDPADNSLAELVARAESHLSVNPQDGRGWDVLAPIYMRMQRHGEAVTAYRNAIRILGSDATREAGLGEALASAAGGVISDEAQQALERAVAHDPMMMRARFMLAAALEQEGRSRDAILAFEGMLGDLPTESPWRAAVERAIVQAGGGLSGPRRDASAQTSDDQVAMIDAMVSGLDQRLRDNPDDPEGWQRLVRSYVVLERDGDARDALARGLAALGAQSENGIRLSEFAASLGLSE